MEYNDDENALYLEKIDELVKKRMNTIAHEDAIAARFREFITNGINGRDMTLVIKKILYASDLLKSQNRLSMPINQLETHEFLTENEKQDLENGNEFEVELLGPSLRMHDDPMVMKKWRLKSSCSYVLKTNWNEFVRENDDVMKESTKICVWSFRKGKKLCFALACIDDVY